MPTCSKCKVFYPAATSHPGCSSDMDPRFKKIDTRGQQGRVYEGREKPRQD